jgi:hypothetical protein
MKQILVIASILLLTACGKVDNFVNGVKSATGNLDRTVTLYNETGGVIKSWKTSNTVEYVGPVAGFIDKDGTNVRVSGTFIIEGK